MKFGIRTPSLAKVLKARTTARLMREVKKEILPWYGKKGMGLITDPKRAIYNKIYKKTSFSIWDLFKQKGVM